MVSMLRLDDAMSKLTAFLSILTVIIMFGLSSTKALAGGEWRGGHDLYGDYQGTDYYGDSIAGDGEGYNVWGAMGVMQGESHLKLFSSTTGALAGQADWDFSSVIMMGLGVNMNLSDWFAFNASGWFSVDGESDLVTFAYAQPAINNWTDSENFSGTEIDNASKIDINGAFHLYRDRGITVSGLIGYRHEELEASNKGGSFVVSSSPVTFRDITGTYPAGRVGYLLDQSLSVPYFGLEAEYQGDRFTFKGRVIGSIWGEYDVQIMEGTKVSQVNLDIEDVHVIGVALEGRYRISDRFSILAGFDYIHYQSESVSTPVITGVIPGGVTTNRAEFEHENYTFSAGINYEF